MMLLFLVDSKKMLALGVTVRQRADSAATWRGPQWPGHGKTYQVSGEAATSVAGSACSFSVSNTGSAEAATCRGDGASALFWSRRSTSIASRYARCGRRYQPCRHRPSSLPSFDISPLVVGIGSLDWVAAIWNTGQK